MHVRDSKSTQTGSLTTVEDTKMKMIYRHVEDKPGLMIIVIIIVVVIIIIVIIIVIVIIISLNGLTLFSLASRLNCSHSREML